MRLLRNRDGAIAIEFAMLAPLFVALMFSAFEVGWLMTKSTLLDRALDITIRSIRVGSATAPTTQAEMVTMICSYMYVIKDCTTKMTVEMTTITSASDFPTADAACVDRAKNITPVVSFSTGSRATIMYVRACLVTDALTPYVGVALNFSLDSQGGYNMVATSAFMNEPGD
jgi:Flp pilus assembly protein TadG